MSEFCQILPLKIPRTFFFQKKKEDTLPHFLIVLDFWIFKQIISQFQISLSLPISIYGNFLILVALLTQFNSVPEGLNTCYLLPNQNSALSLLKIMSIFNLHSASCLIEFGASCLIEFLYSNYQITMSICTEDTLYQII